MHFKKILFNIRISLVVILILWIGNISLLFSPTFSLLAHATAPEQDSPSISKIAPPIIQDMDLFTTKNIELSGTLRTYTSQQQPFRIEITQAPHLGELSFKQSSFHYTPFLNATGVDTVVCVAIDSAGNRSDPATLTFHVEPSNHSFFYEDMKQNPSHYSAIQLRKQQLLRGEQVGQVHLFHPKQTVTAGEFLLCLLSALNIQQSAPPTVNTTLKNDSDIPIWLKPYVMLAITQGIITENKFDTNQTLTNAQAVVYVSRAAAMPDVHGYHLGASDIHHIPRWAIQSYLNLGSYRMLDLYDGATHSTTLLTRDTAADLIWQLFKYSQENPSIH